MEQQLVELAGELLQLARELGAAKAEIQSQAAVIQALVMAHPDRQALCKNWDGVRSIVTSRSEVSFLSGGSPLEQVLRDRLSDWDKLFSTLRSRP